jgi:hypothetical protein
MMHARASCATLRAPNVWENNMANNLMVSFEIGDWRRQGPLIVAAIEELGPCARVFGTTWYVCAQMDAPEAAACIRDVLGTADGLLVVDVTGNVAATYNVDERSVEFISAHWCRPGPVVNWVAWHEAEEAPIVREPLSIRTANPAATGFRQ